MGKMLTKQWVLGCRNTLHFFCAYFHIFIMHIRYFDSGKVNFTEIKIPMDTAELQLQANLWH